MGTRIVVMKNGLSSRSPPPQELFDRPCNLFVATFIGTPQMNVAEATLEGNPQDARLRFGEGIEVSLRLPDEKAKKPALAPYFGKQVFFGIRPNDIHAEPDYLAQHPEQLVNVNVEFVERLGAESNIFCKAAGVEFAAVADSKHIVENGANVKLAFDTATVHIFDMDTENTITN